MRINDNHENRNVVLDFFRFIAVLLVLFRHLIIKEQNGLSQVLRPVQRGGWIGVDLFFVLSGFLVSGLIFREIQRHGSFSAKNFLIRRGFKIYPSYYLFLVSTLLIFCVKDNYRVTLEGFLSECFFVNNYLGYDHFWLWSIAVEEHFYFVLCILIFLFVRKKILNFYTISISYLVFLIVGFLFRWVNYCNYSDWDWMKDVAKSHFRFDSLFFGVVLSYLVTFHRYYLDYIFRVRWILVFISIGYLTTNFIWPIEMNRWMPLFSLSLNPIFFGLLLIIFMEDKFLTEFRIVKSLAYIGKYSYPIYLFHQMINLCFFFGRYNFWLDFTGYFLSSIGFGIIFSKVVEYPFLKWRDKHFPSRQ